jgi:hypothetical protein
MMCTHVALIVSGFVLGGLWMIVLPTASAAAFVCGLKSHNPNPLTFGVMTFWGRIIGDGIVVSGTVPTIPWFPFLLDTIEIPMTRQRIRVSITSAVSSDMVKMSGEITFTVDVNPRDMADFVSIGMMKGVEENITSPVALVVEKLCGSKPWREIQQRAANFEPELRKLIDSGSYGVTVEHIQVQLSAPTSLLEDITDAERERAQKGAEDAEFQTNLDAAQKLHAALLAARIGNEKIPSLADCLDTIIKQKVQRGGRMQVIQGGRPVVVTGSGRGGTP